MDKYRTFMLAAAPGFGAPAAPETNTKTRGNRSGKLSKDQVAKWRARPESFREAYLKSHPGSRFKDIPVRGTIITRSKRMSNKKEAKNVVANGAAFLSGLGLRAGKITSEQAKGVLQHLRSFKNAKDREPFISKAVGTFNKYRGRLSKKDQADVEQEARDINNNPRERPSKVLDRKGHRGKLPALVGLAVGVALFGGLALISPEIALYLGVKALDLGVESARTAASEPLGAFFAGHTIASFFKSRDSDEYADDVDRKLAKQHDPHGHLDEEKRDGENDNEEEPDEVKDAVSKKIPGFDTTKYEKDQNGNLILKRKANAGNQAT